ncbi:outer membrane beta-barrel protein [Bradyrhizobium sp. 199]|uniref:outer membrane protein n=1 Tax=Bradyrhizobium sp. 199 TaxID=2782664 RepID=UPI001FFBD1E7|nr:outer membrane beta-barrel protein [Bradyrhizobium sp. 199]MCK1361554.1 porin family protein [Bradyrhizobium sp. 199]
MKKLLMAAAGTLALGLAAPASAADLAARPYTKAPPMAVAMYDWSGFYIGANGGWGTSRKCWDMTQFVGFPVVPAGAEGCHDASGGTVGGQIGYRWQTGAYVFGLEAQGNWADFNGSNSSTFIIARNQSKVDAFGLFTGQIGYTWNNVLLYVKGGAAVTHDKYAGRTIPGDVVFDSGTETRWGGTVGVGLEYGFTPNWSVGVEYNHMFMGHRDVAMSSTGAIAPVGGIIRVDRIGQDVDVVTARINYRFGGPVVARY